MGSIQISSSKKGIRYKASVRIKGFPKEFATFSSEEAAQRWIDEREASLLQIRAGGSMWNVGGTDYLHVKTGKPRAILMRNYQAAAISEAHRALAAKKNSAPLIVMPTGSGKTIVIAGLIERLLNHYSSGRFLVVSHAQELVDQDYRKFLEFSCVTADQVGIASAGLGQRDVSRKITFGTIQTLVHEEDLGALDVIIVDEAHLIPLGEEAMYQRLIASARKKNPDVRVIGLTATPYRLDSGLLTEGEGAIFTEIAYECDIQELVRDGFLSPLISLGSLNHVDDSLLEMERGEFTDHSSEEAMNGLTPKIMEEILRHGQERKSWLVFCVSIRHANQVAEALVSNGIEARVVSSQQSAKQREESIDLFRSGALRALVNVNVLTTGFDVPRVDLLISLRPTTSQSLWVQMCGRGMRKDEGKRNCLVLDYANNIARHGPIDLIKGTKKGGVPARWNPKNATKCPSCGTLCGPRLSTCPNCGSLLRAEVAVELADAASLLPVLSGHVSLYATPHRMEDISSIIEYYLIDDVAPKLRERLLQPDVYVGLRRNLHRYTALLREHGYHDPDGVYVEPAIPVDMIAPILGRSVDDLKQAIASGSFPRPRVLMQSEDPAETEDFGYSLMQLAAIQAGEVSEMIILDETYLWYVGLLDMVKLELIATGHDYRNWSP